MRKKWLIPRYVLLCTGSNMLCIYPLVTLRILDSSERFGNAFTQIDATSDRAAHMRCQLQTPTKAGTQSIGASRCSGSRPGGDGLRPLEPSRPPLETRAGPRACTAAASHPQLTEWPARRIGRQTWRESDGRDRCSPSWYCYCLLPLQVWTVTVFPQYTQPARL